MVTTLLSLVLLLLVAVLVAEKVRTLLTLVVLAEVVGGLHQWQVVLEHQDKVIQVVVQEPILGELVVAVVVKLQQVFLVLVLLLVLEVLVH
jgi:hypothetical protein